MRARRQRDATASVCDLVRRRFSSFLVSCCQGSIHLLTASWYGDYAQASIILTMNTPLSLSRLDYAEGSLTGLMLLSTLPPVTGFPNVGILRCSGCVCPS